MKDERSGIGETLRQLRQSKRLTLAALGKRTGYSVSALSKMENERLGITYDKLTKLAGALDVDISSLFTGVAQVQGPPDIGRRSIARKGSGRPISAGLYDHLYVSPELSTKQMVPILVKIQAMSMEEFGPFIRHGGEEWIYVLKVSSQKMKPAIFGGQAIASCVRHWPALRRDVDCLHEARGPFTPRAQEIYVPRARPFDAAKQ